MRAGWALRPAGGWSVLLARLSSMGDHAVAVRRTALALVGLVTVVFGWWGFARYSGQHPDVGLGWPEWLYGTMNLFINGADVAPVPWQLGVARMLAPLVTFGVLVEVLLVGSAQRIRRWAASRASGHVLVVGPTERVRPYLQGSADDRGLGDGTELIVHIGQDGSALGPTVIGLPATPTPIEWVAVTPARAARRIVLALGRDDLTLSALRGALDHGLPEAGCSLVVELDDIELSGRMAVAVAGKRPDADIDFVCPEELDALLISASVTDELVGSHGSDRGWAVSIVGDTPTCDRVTAQLVRAFTRSALRGGAVRPCILRVRPGGSEREAQIVDNHRVVVDVVDRIDDIFQPGAPDHLVIDLHDEEMSTRLAMEAALRRRGSVVWTTHGFALPWATTGCPADGSPVDLRQVSLSAAAKAGALHGPFGRIAAARTRRTGQAPSGPSTDAVRRAVAILLDQGWTVVPESDLQPAERGRLPRYVDQHTARLLRSLPGLEEDASHLLYELQCEGLMAIPPVWESDGGVGPVEMPPDETIEVMAQAIHEHYLTEQAEQTNLPALRPWAELDERFRAQNRDQARDNILKLHSLGLKVVAAGLLSVDAVRLGEADIERLGIAEHDRWSHQKREQGYRFGPELILDGADLRHPSLLPWDELPASEKEKDVAPIRQIPAVLAAAGLAITR